MNWKKTSEYSIESNCGNYHIAKSYVDKQENYMLWYHRHVLGCWPTANQAKLNAEAHKKENGK